MRVLVIPAAMQLAALQLAAMRVAAMPVAAMRSFFDALLAVLATAQRFRQGPCVYV